MSVVLRIDSLNRASIGSAVVVDSRHLVTCFHVVKDIREYVVLACDPTRNASLQCNVIDYDESLDLALLRAQGHGLGRPARFCCGHTDEHNTAFKGLDLRAQGFPTSSKAGQPNFGVGIHDIFVDYGGNDDRTAKLIESSGGLDSGMSGGMLSPIGKAGELGICLGIIQKGGKGRARAVFVASDAVVAFVQQHVHRVKAISFSDLEQRLQRSGPTPEPSVEDRQQAAADRLGHDCVFSYSTNDLLQEFAVIPRGSVEIEGKTVCLEHDYAISTNAMSLPDVRSWLEAQDYARYHNLSLPSEVEWEYALLATAIGRIDANRPGSCPPYPNAWGLAATPPRQREVVADTFYRRRTIAADGRVPLGASGSRVTKDSNRGLATRQSIDEQRQFSGLCFRMIMRFGSD